MGISAIDNYSGVHVETITSDAGTTSAGDGKHGQGGGTTLSPSAPQPLQDQKAAIEAASAQTGIPANTLGAVMWRESRGVPGTPGGGLFQIGQPEFDAQKAKHPDLIKGDINDPASNVMAGALYLKDLQGGGDIGLGLRKYNSGPNGADPNNLSATPAGTGDPAYVDAVMDYSRKLDAGQPLPP
jgi:soluble lytic murein transglycosylase-like protein